MINNHHEYCFDLNGYSGFTVRPCLYFYTMYPSANSEKCKLEDIYDASPKVKEYTLKNYEGDTACYQYCKTLKESDIFTVGKTYISHQSSLLFYLRR